LLLLQTFLVRSACLLELINQAAFCLRQDATNPSKPDPINHAAAGTGTADADASTFII
jgi:hypothetical protein